VLRQGAALGAAALLAHAEAHLGRYEVPGLWWTHAGPLPTNPSGKLLRRVIRDEWPRAADGNHVGHFPAS
jgi:acyl-CoA synthetase (AMP-forming)/AMP-acid ligase II